MILLVLVVVLSSSLLIGWQARRAFGEITIEKYDLERLDGRVVSFRVYAPTANTYGQPRPAVLTIHGISGSGAMMDAYNMELARRNFTVISVDLPGHGRSQETFGFDAFFEAVNDAYEAVRHVQLTDPDTDDTLYGILGHSLGAGISLFFENVSIQPQSTVIIGGGMGDQFGGLVPPINETSPRNLLLASGTLDELVSPQTALDTLARATGVASPLPGITYGNFSDGTARKLVFSFTDHLFETSDSVIVSESVDWLVRALQGQAQLGATLNPSLQVYQVASLIDLVGASSFVLSIFPVFLISYALVPRHLRPERRPTVPEALDGRRSVRYSFVVGIPTALLLLVALLAGFGLEFAGIVIVPVSFGTGSVILSLFSAILVLRLSRRYLDSSTIQGLTPELRGKDSRQQIIEIGRGALVIAPVVAWILIWSLVARIGLDAAPPFTFSIESGAALFRFVCFLLLTVLLLPLFYADTLWLNATVGTLRSWTGLKDLTSRMGRAMASRLLGLLVLIAVLYIPFLSGFSLGFVMFIALLMLPFTLILGLTALMTVWVNSITRNNVTAALLNAVLLALVIAGTFQLL
jgi:alpha/beta superfamily hydrolase